jgi:hypothetical protein
MKHTLLLILAIIGIGSMASRAQNPNQDVYIGTTNFLSLFWSGNFNKVAETAAGQPYEGIKHYIFDYNVQSYWAAGGFNVDGWGWGTKIDLRKYTHLQYAIKTGTGSLGVQLMFNLEDINGNQTQYVPVGTITTTSGTYQLVSLPLHAFWNKSSLFDPSHLHNINFQISGAGASGQGKFYMDAIQFKDYSNITAGSVNVNTDNTYNMGAYNINTSSPAITFSIKNLGALTSTNDTLTGSPLISVSGPNASDFTVDTSSTNPVIGANSAGSFTVTFTPSDSVPETATLFIPNTYSYDGYYITLTGKTPYPEMQVYNPYGVVAASSSTFDFGGFVVGQSTPDTGYFAIINPGEEPLILSGTPPVTISGPNSADFILDTSIMEDTLAAGDTTYFSIIFNPADTGTVKSAVLSIINNAFQTPSPFLINLRGSATNTPKPHITVYNDSTLAPIFSGDTFSINAQNAIYYFLIYNSGTDTLTFTGKMLELILPTADSSIALYNWLSFYVVNGNQLPPGGYAYYGMSFSPRSNGVKYAQVKIYTNDSTNLSYVINIKAGTPCTMPDTTTSVNTATITANATGASYQWIDCDNGNAPITGETNQSFTATQNGNYAVIVTQNGCPGISACVNISSIVVTGINSGAIDMVTVSPNPSSGIFTMNGSADYTFSIRSIIGEEKLIQTGSNGTNTLDLSAYPSGVYFLNIRTGTTSRIIKLIKE